MALGSFDLAVRAAICQAALGEQHPDTLTSANHFATIVSVVRCVGIRRQGEGDEPTDTTEPKR